MMDEVEGEQDLSETEAQTSTQEVFDNKNKTWWDSEKRVRTGDSFEPRRLDTPLDQIVRKKTGRRSRTKTDNRRGRYIQARSSNGNPYDLAFDATLRSAAPFQNERKEMLKKVAFAVRPSDYMRKVRVKKTANLVLFLVDASWSMAVAERMAATKGAILSLLTDAYQRRDKVGLVVFQKDKATLVLPPTNSVLLAQKALEDIPVGGKTPLSAGLRLTYEVLMREKTLHPDVTPILLVLTDGAGNVSYGDLPPWKRLIYWRKRSLRKKFTVLLSTWNTRLSIRDWHRHWQTILKHRATRLPRSGLKACTILSAMKSRMPVYLQVDRYILY